VARFLLLSTRVFTHPGPSSSGRYLYSQLHSATGSSQRAIPIPAILLIIKIKYNKNTYNKIFSLNKKLVDK